MKHFYDIYYGLFCVTLCFSYACNKKNTFNCFTPAGKYTTEHRSLPSFHSIVIQDNIDVYLTQNSEYTAVVKAGKNLISNIHTEVKNETLYISNENKCNFLRDPKKKVEAYIHLPELRYLKHIGSGNISTLNTFVQDTLLLRIESPGDVRISVQTNYTGGSTHGNGDLYISGGTNYFYYYYNGTNYIHAENLKINNYTYLESHSVGHAYVNINNAGMDAALFSNGNIYYSGNPIFLNYYTRGKGTVIKQ